MSVKKFANILKKIHKNKISGTLTLVFPKGNRYVYINDGEISYLRSDYPEEKLGNILVRQNLLTQNELDVALKESKKEGMVLGEYLVNNGKISIEQIKQSLKILFLMIIEACFLEDMKDINFVEKDIIIDKKLFMDIKTGNLVLETFRKINHKDFEDFYKEHKDKKPILHKEIIFDYRNLNLNPLEGFILSRIDGKLTLEEIKKIAFTDEITFYKTIFALNFLGLLDFGEEKESDVKEETYQQQAKQVEQNENQTNNKQKKELSEKDKQFIKHVEDLYVELPTINYYDLLIVDYKFSEEELKQNYHRLIKKYHPDSHPELKEIHHHLHSIISKITEAYNTLRNPDEREKYNKKMHIKPFPKEPEQKKEKIKKDIIETDQKEELKNKIEQYIKAGMFYDAITLLENGCRKYKDDIYFFKTLGLIYYRTPTKLKQAIYYLEKAHTMNRKDLEVLKTLASAYKKVEFYRESYSFYKKVLAIDPDDSEANKFIAEVEKKGSFLDKFKNLFSKE
ncbi:hypothetical protein TTHT_0844 [Thermotomaculum hydrothermale]|uniref:J domain-containing protein n=1 Tax=Thermotomaculum hydrothermale TaxID=981385 RepID=A0A7R6PNN3_9BACT|nr:J domain-containing protein [Thermotomaculum hydrothermale]BBB32406.1 hypothetical protein TTHT_0844 [Thermotomaculum hydrothermale]